MDNKTVEAIREMFEERAAIVEHDGGQPRIVAEAIARSAIRVYELVVWKAQPGDSPRCTAMVITPGQDFIQVEREARESFGNRFISLKEVPRKEVKAVIKGDGT